MLLKKLSKGSFNSTLVQLKVCKSIILQSLIVCFNSTLVQLKAVKYCLEYT